MRDEPAKPCDQMGRLTPRQKDCLRLVGLGYQSKPIARELGISPLRVDKHIAEARRILGTASRTEAAKLLRCWERQQVAPPWGAPQLALPDELPQASNDDMDPIDANTQMRKPTARGPQQPGPETGNTLRMGPLSFRFDRNAGFDAGSSSALILSITAIASLAAVGAVASLLFALDWVGRS